ncbi:hypothetical protein AB0J80_01070 [Actinoplanes sp. NPDC049548]|uniref:hypothetical protein n=1 Tax=Actinoplanes sp. NPDC049548 TaxID=3155152 RepID=UPI00342BA553
MSARRIRSRTVVLTATYLALAAGGAAACDASSADEWESADGTTYTYDDSDSGTTFSDDEEEDEEQPSDEVFYCADEDGKIVDEDRCDDDSGSTSYFLWHSAGYPRHLKPGTKLDGGDHFRANDQQSRRAFKLPTTGKVTNGTVKTNVVGSRSSGSGTSAGHSTSGG